MTRLWHAAISLVAAVALVTQLVLVIDKDASVTNFFSYFTIQSNILVMIAAALIAVRPDRGGTAFRILRMAGLVGITITGIIFSTVLAGTVEFEGIAWWTDKAFHYLVPAMAVTGFIFMKPRTRLDRSSVWFLAWALAWLAYTLIRAEVSEPRFAVTNDRFATVPYDFLDSDQHGTTAVAVACAGVLVLALAISAFYIWLSQRDAETATV
ncbi:Pr6Pr family membrane protein [Aeromicrobium sp.]|uniref:Pr6Pr family membrane protein n=1 Tax=Aeromicrobium sp. TaxID=1871063 RepID=UPI002FC7A0A3